MKLSTLTVDEVAKKSVHALGLDEETVGANYPEAICASLRRAASFLCPSPPRALVDAVLEVLSPVLPEPPTRDDLMIAVDQLVSTGDLLELFDDSTGRRARLLFLHPPSYVEKVPGRYLIAGIRPLGVPLVPADIAIEYEGHTRTAVLDPDGAEERLRAVGLHKITAQQWIGQPTVLAATDYIHKFQQRLDFAQAAGVVDGLTIVGSSIRPRYYRSRWRAPATGDTGDFIGRRPQAYGADRWCVVRLVEGVPKQLLDLPLDSAVTPGRDDAWRLQAAIDAECGVPPSYGVGPASGSALATRVVDFYSPVPGWAQRYLELVGLPVERSKGALFSYRVPASALAGLQTVLTETLWMNMVTNQEGQ